MKNSLSAADNKPIKLFTAGANQLSSEHISQSFHWESLEESPLELFVPCYQELQ